MLSSGSWFTDEEKIFDLEAKPTRVLPYTNDFHNAVTYELSNSNQVYYRNVYGLLDYLRDIGGLYGALTALCFALVYIFQHNGANMFVMTEMFTAPKKNLQNDAEPRSEFRRENLRDLKPRNKV